MKTKKNNRHSKRKTNKKGGRKFFRKFWKNKTVSKPKTIKVNFYRPTPKSSITRKSIAPLSLEKSVIRSIQDDEFPVWDIKEAAEINNLLTLHNKCKKWTYRIKHPSKCKKNKKALNDKKKEDPNIIF